MQKYFQEIGEMNGREESPKKGQEQVFSQRLKKIELTLREMYEFFNR